MYRKRSQKYGGRKMLTNRNAKCADVDPQAVTPTTSPTWILTNGISSGTEFSRRLGNKLKLSSLVFKYQVRPSTTDSTNAMQHARLRCVVIYDRQANGAAPTAWSDVFSGRTAADPVASSTLEVTEAMPNVDNRDRFIVLYDRVHQLQPNISDVNGYSRAIDFGERLGRINFKNTKLYGLPVYYSGTTAAVGSIRTGTLHIGFIASQATACTVQFLGARLFFNDAPQ